MSSSENLNLKLYINRWLRPGYDIIASNQGSDIAVIAGRSVTNGEMVIVALNQWNFERVFGVDLSAYASFNGTNSNLTVNAYRTSDTEDHAEISAPPYDSNGVVSIVAPIYSVTTVIISGMTWIR